MTYRHWKITSPDDSREQDDPAPSELDLVYEDLAKAHTALRAIAKLATAHELATAEPQIKPTKAKLSQTLDFAIYRARTAIAAKSETRS
jgi:hypothetical protein